MQITMRSHGAYVLPLPEHVQDTIAELARLVPTPSAMALRAHLEACPWIPAVVEAFPKLSQATIILQAEQLGLTPCWKCDGCAYATLHRILC